MSDTDRELVVERRWVSSLLESSEDFVLSHHREGFRLAGATGILRDGAPVEIRYHVEAGTDWSTRSALIDIPSLQMKVKVVVEGGTWMVGGEPQADLDGCVDIDLGWTPATNTLPIRRLRLVTGVPQDIRAAWLRWPELSFSASNQTYTKHSEGRWTYASGDFSAKLTVDGQGVVVTYGRPAIWDTV